MNGEQFKIGDIVREPYWKSLGVIVALVCEGGGVPRRKYFKIYFFTWKDYGYLEQSVLEHL